MNNKRFTGIMPAMITPFDDNGTLKASSAAKIMAKELEGGIQGFYVNGATGEGLFLSEKTRMEMAEVAVDVCKGRGAVINHVGAVDVQAALRLARHAGSIGCDAVSSLVPNYVTEYTEDQIVDYYKRLADVSSVPVLVYCTGLLKSDPCSFIERIMKIDNIIGLKYTMFNYYNMQYITQINGGDINVINGPDEMLICGLTMGADGGIGSTYNLMPAWFTELFDAFKRGDFPRAQTMQARINKVIRVLLKHGCIASIKEVLSVMGYDAGNVAFPGKRFDIESCKQLINDLIVAGFPMDGSAFTDACSTEKSSL